MANGPSTDLFQTALRLLMQGRSLSPVAPVDLPPVSSPPISPSVPSGGFTPPGGFIPMPPGPPPEPAPIAPAAALDQSLIEQLTGAPPTAPTPQPDSLLQKISRALIGFGAGMQGQGPQYLASLREERERPQREYQQQVERYQNRRAQAVELATRKQEREQARTQEQADRQADREFNVWLKRTGVTDQIAIENLRAAFDAERDARRAQEEQRKEGALFKKQIALQIDDRIKAYRDQGASPGHAAELARSDFRMALEQVGETVAPLSPGAANANKLIQAKLQRAQRLAGGGGGRAERIETFAELSDGSIVPADKIKLDILPAGVTVKRLFSPQLQARQAPAATTLTAEMVRAALQSGKTPAELRASARSEAERKIIEDAIKASGAPASGLTVQEAITRAATPGGETVANIAADVSSVGSRAATFNEKMDTVNWLRNRLGAARSLAAREKNPKRKAEYEAEVADLQSRLQYAESQFQR